MWVCLTMGHTGHTPPMITMFHGDNEVLIHWNLGYPIFRQTNAAWWYTYPSEKYEFVSWVYSSQYMEK